MGYLFLFIALLAGSTKGYCGKKTSGYTTGFSGAILTNVVRMILCCIIGFVLILVGGELGALVLTRDMLVISAVSGISTAVFVVTWLVCARKSAFMMLDIFLMLGMLIPMIASSMLFQEMISPFQWLGILILFVAVLIMCSYNNSIKAKLTPSALLLLLLSGVSNGISSFSQKYFMKQIPDGSAAAFNLYTYVFAGLTLIIAYAIAQKTEKEAEKTDLKKIGGYVLVMAVCLFANSYFKTLAAGYLSAAILYPVSQGLGLIMAAFMSSVFFKEKLTLKAVVGIVVAFAALLIINFL